MPFQSLHPKPPARLHLAGAGEGARGPSKKLTLDPLSFSKPLYGEYQT
jgi:hypothetical protein